MTSVVPISDDEDNGVAGDSILTWDGSNDTEKYFDNTDFLSSDEEFSKVGTAGSVCKNIDTVSISSDEDELPDVNIKKARSKYIKQLFPNSSNMPSTSGNRTVPQVSQFTSSQVLQEKPKGVVKMIGGVEVCLPVNPYGSQIALIAKIIEGMRKGKNCLLESPTGSGKTLALLCGALACQMHEKGLIAKCCVQELLASHQQVSRVEGVSEYVASPKKPDVTPEKLFEKNNFGTKTIYDETANVVDLTRIFKREGPAISKDDEKDGTVRIHKKARLLSPPQPGANGSTPTKAYGVVDNAMEICGTPEKPIDVHQSESPEQLSTPIIYYGARTHKQIEQVVKEFGRTWYCGQSKMTLLSSREYSCIREFDRKVWGTKNDMCRGCIKAVKTKDEDKSKKGTNCKYYDNRAALNRRTLPPAFDLEDLVSKGHELNACPFYAARAMEADADIVFCPYNYLIDPSIRDSLNIKLEGNIVIIDEAHNIEDICRDSATYSITREQIAGAIKELDIVLNYRFQNDEALSYVQKLHKALCNFEQWFTNQLPLVNKEPVTNGEASYKWEVLHFIQTLNNHNIGQAHYTEICSSAEVFCRMLRDNPRALLGATQATANLVANIAAALGYLFRDSGKHMEDFKPILTHHVAGDLDDDNKNWRSSQFNKSIQSESYSLKFLCLNPAVVFEALKVAKSVILTSGTLTPMDSFHSELGTDFELKVSPGHVIPKDRVWIGTLRCGPNGDLTCTSKNMQNSTTQDDIGRAIGLVCEVTPHGVLCFMPSYHVLYTLTKRWRETGLWRKLEKLKNIYQESRDVHDHNKIMEMYQERSCEGKGALLLAVYRGKVSEGMDFKDRQARAVVTVGIPFPNTFDVAVVEKKNYNNKYSVTRNLLSGDEWLKVQAYRALNQALGRCVRHRGDWGAVLMVDARFCRDSYTVHLSRWIRDFLGGNHHTFDTLVESSNSLQTFMQYMTLKEEEN